MKKFKKIVMLLLAATVAFACFAALGVSAAAAGKISYTVEQENGVAYLSANPADEDNYLVYTTDGSVPKADGKVLAFYASIKKKTFVRIAEFTPEGKRVSGVKLTVSPKMPNVEANVTKNDGYTTVSLSCAAKGAEIHYTTDGSEPTVDSPLYDGILSFDKKTRIRYAAFKEDCKRSAIISKTISVSAAKPVETPAVKQQEPEEDTSAAVAEDVNDDVGTGEKIKYKVQYFEDNGYTKITFNLKYSGDVIYYTLDGTTPSKSSRKYSSYIKVYEPCTLKAVEYTKAGKKVATIKYNVRLKCAHAEYECIELYKGTRTIKLTTKTEGATIYYTLNGESPSGANARVYTGPIDVGDQTPISTIVKKNGYLDSYTESKVAADITLENVSYDSDDPVVWEVINAINAERKARGARTLNPSDQMLRAASIRVKEAAIYPVHSRPNGEGYITAIEDQGIAVGMKAEIFAYNYANPENYFLNIKGTDDEKLLFGTEYLYNSIGVGVHRSGKNMFLVILIANVV